MTEKDKYQLILDELIEPIKGFVSALTKKGELLINKVKSVEDNKDSDEKYPSAKATYEYGQKIKDSVIPAVNAPKVWELLEGIYKVSGFVAVDNEGTGFYVADKSLLVVNKDGDKTIFYLYLGGYGEYPYEIVTGTTDGTTSVWYGIESDKNKVSIINKNSTYVDYPSAKAVFDFVTEILENISVEGAEQTSNKVTEITEESTDEQYPSAKAVYDLFDKDQSAGNEGSVFQVLPTGKNLLNRETDTVGYNLTETGELVSSSTYEVTDFIPITENEHYVLSDNGVSDALYTRTICYYDINKNIIGYATYIQVYPITMPENAKYVRFSFSKNLTYPQFEQNTVATEYETFCGVNLIDGNRLYIPDKSLAPEKMSFFGTKAGGKNLLDRTKSTVGYILTATGELSSNSKAETSDYIAVTYGDNLYMSGTPEEGYTTVIIGYAFYDENKNLVSVVERMNLGGQNPLPIPRNIKYIRYSYRKAGMNVQIERGTAATEYEEFIPVPCLKSEYMNFKQPKDHDYTVNPWFGKRLIVDGDSITHDQGKYNYWQFVAAQLTDMYVDNSDTATEYANGWKGVGGSRIANELGANDPMYSIVLRYQNLPDDADLVMIAAGTNDWAHDNVLLGDFDSTDDTTFNGALNILLPGLKEKYPTIPVVMMTPIKRGTYGQLNKNGNTQEEFVEAMIKKCRQYNVYCLDMWANCPINPNITAMEQLYVKDDGTNDKTHPNTEGHKVMGRTVAGFIRTLS